MPKEEIRHRTYLILNLVAGEEEGNIRFPSTAGLRTDLGFDDDHMAHLITSLDHAFDGHHFPWEQLFTAAKEDVTAAKEDVTAAKEDVTAAKEDVTAAKEDVTVGELVEFLHAHIYDKA
ncbi:MAG: hypothetical protein ACI9QL_003371 [Candidatus Omnitrophota bacterium]|jgi:hypothetical protein